MTILLLISIVVNLLFISYIFIQNARNEKVMNQYYSFIQQDLVHLDAAITFQISTNWENENFVILKIYEVKKNISQALHIGTNLKVLTEHQKGLLNRIYEFFDNIDKHTGYPQQYYTDEEKGELIKLHERLVKAELSIENNSYSNRWGEFEDKLLIILNDGVSIQ